MKYHSLTQEKYEELKSILKPHWNFFLSLENDLQQLSRYVEIDKRNYKTFSIELVKLILTTNSEVDVMLKLLAQEIFGRRLKNPDIIGYRTVFITENHAGKILDQTVTLMLNSDIQLQPWHQWGQKKGPKWWREYQEVKHHRSTKYDSANLRNALYSMSALLSLNMFSVHYYNMRPDYMIPTSLFSSSGVPELVWT